jgi:hypothetical protein
LELLPRLITISPGAFFERRSVREVWSEPAMPVTRARGADVLVCDELEYAQDQSVSPLEA